jgi:hypothetical protein
MALPPQLWHACNRLDTGFWNLDFGIWIADFGRWRVVIRSFGLNSYCQVSCHKKQEDFGFVHLQVYTSVIPARFWPESRHVLAWIPAKGMPE